MIFTEGKDYYRKEDDFKYEDKPYTDFKGCIFDRL